MNSKAATQLLILIGCYLFVNLIAGLAFTGLSFWWNIALQQWFMLSTFLWIATHFFPELLAHARQRTPIPRASLSWILPLTAGIAVAMSLSAHYLEAHAHFPPLFETTYAPMIRMHDSLSALRSAALLAAFPAITEEIVFRGLLYAAAFSCFGSTWRANIFVSVLFALAHRHFHFFPFYFAQGLYLGWLRMRYNSLPLSMITHGWNNFVTLVVLSVS